MKIICIGRNYREHIKELDHTDSYPTEPQFFMKPDTALLRNNDPFYVPDFSKELHYETELVIKISRVAKAIPLEFAHRCYEEIGLGIDFTARDVQRDAIAKGLPWEKSKAFDHSAAVSPVFIKKEELPPVGQLKFSMKLNGELKQQGSTADMIFAVDEIISYISRFITLKIGDYIFTGTPAGVGPVNPGDHLEAELEGRKLLDFEIK